MWPGGKLCTKVSKSLFTNVSSFCYQYDYEKRVANVSIVQCDQEAFLPMWPVPQTITRSSWFFVFSQKKYLLKNDPNPIYQRDRDTKDGEIIYSSRDREVRVWKIRIMFIQEKYLFIFFSSSMCKCSLLHPARIVKDVWMKEMEGYNYNSNNPSGKAANFTQANKPTLYRKCAWFGIFFICCFL